MNDKFDELAKGLAQSVTRRGALKKFGLGLAGIALAALGLANKAEAARGCRSDADCGGLTCCGGKCVISIPTFGIAASAGSGAGMVSTVPILDLVHHVMTPFDRVRKAMNQQIR